MPHHQLFVVFALLSTGAYAQWLNYPTPGTPRTPDGKPNLAAPAPRAANNKPDLSGIWQVEATPFDELTRLFGAQLGQLSVPGDDPRTFSKYLINILADFKREDAPMRPDTAEVFRKRVQSHGNGSPTTRCLPAGLPFAEVFPIPFKVIQTPGLIVMVYEGDGTIRQIYTDGRKHPSDPQPLWLGYSVGSWEADTLVVDTAGFNDKSWLDAGGHPHSDALHLIERFQRRDFGHMDVMVTIEDPKMYTRPFSVKFTEILQPDTDITESFCAENEKDWTHMERQ
jgi:hypothetical protein